MLDRVLSIKGVSKVIEGVAGCIVPATPFYICPKCMHLGSVQQDSDAHRCINSHYIVTVISCYL